MSGGIVSYGTYNFPQDTLQEFRTNFGDGVPRTQRLPGLDGGFSDDGGDPPNTQIGKIDLGFYLVAQSRDEMDDKRDAVMAMYEYGLAKLVYQPTDTNDATRFCWAQVNYINMSQQKHEHTDLHQKVAITFQVPDPKWLVEKYNSETFGDGYQFDDGLTFGDGALELACSGVETSHTVTNSGTATAVCMLSVLPGAGNTCENPQVERIADGRVLDGVRYTGTLAADDELICDGRTGRAVLAGLSVFGSAFEYEDPAFLRLPPGSSTVRVRFANVGDAATLRLWYYDTFR